MIVIKNLTILLHTVVTFKWLMRYIIWRLGSGYTQIDSSICCIDFYCLSLFMHLFHYFTCKIKIRGFHLTNFEAQQIILMEDPNPDMWTNEQCLVRFVGILCRMRFMGEVNCKIDTWYKTEWKWFLYSPSVLLCHRWISWI